LSTIAISKEDGAVKKVNCGLAGICGAALMVSVAMPGMASASLSIEGNAVYDSASNLYWMPNLSLFVNQTYQQQINTISSMGNYNGQSGWHLASSSEMNSLFNNSLQSIAGAFGPSYGGADVTFYSTPVWAEDFRVSEMYYGRFNATTNNTDTGLLGHKSAGMFYGVSAVTGGTELEAVYPDGSTTLYNSVTYPSNSYSDNILGAWVATNVAPTPIPPSFLLMGSGVIWLLGFRKPKRS